MRDATATRQRIQDAALRLFVEHGVTETSIRDLAAAAGIAEGTLYRHYPSKDELVRDLFVTNYAAFGRRLAEALAAADDLAGQIEAAVRAFCRFYDEQPDMFRFLMLTQHQALPRVARNAGNPAELLQRALADGIAARAIGIADAGLATSIVLGILVQSAVSIVYGRIAPPLSRHAGALAAACWRALGPR